MGGAGVLVLLGGCAGGCAGAVRSGKAGRLWALCRRRRWRWCVVIWCGGLLLAWSSGAALAVLILPGAGGGRCDLLRRRCAGGVIWCGAGTMPSACRAADPAGRAGGRRGRWAKEKGQGGGAWCAAALAFCLRWRCDLLRRVRPGAYRGRRWSAPPFRCRAAGAGTDPGATVPAGNVPAWHGLRWRCSIRCVFAVCRRGQILHLTG